MAKKVWEYYLNDDYSFTVTVDSSGRKIGKLRVKGVKDEKPQCLFLYHKGRSVKPLTDRSTHKILC